jgi:DNA-binding GntR family transcriptional regulator
MAVFARPTGPGGVSPTNQPRPTSRPPGPQPGTTGPPRPQASQPQAGRPARAHALGTLREAILSGDLAPGQRLIEEEFAADLSVTRASLRAALMELTAEGLVERVPNKGARVRVVTADEAVAITECRMALEALCAAKAAQHVTDEQISGLLELGERLKNSVSDADPLKYSEANQELHRVVRAISGQTVAVELLQRLNAQLARHQFQLALRPGRPEQSLSEHLAIIDAITRRDPDAADKATRRHLSSVITALRAAGDRKT